MFTGIVEEKGAITAHHRTPTGARVQIRARRVLEGITLGDSIAVNGCCLTVVDAGLDWWAADLTHETLERTTFGVGNGTSGSGGSGSGTPGSGVNLERAVRLTDRLGGHMVQGHVDGVGEVIAPVPTLHIRLPQQLLRYTVEKGSICIDGVSLTIVEVLDDGVTIAVIPHTATVTTLGSLIPGDLVNIEVDVMAKYVERLIAAELDARHREAST